MNFSKNNKLNLNPIPNPQSPIPNPQSPIPKLSPIFFKNIIKYINK